MGGKNHQPTKRTSLEITVPMSAALSRMCSHLNLANLAIEECIMTRGLSFGAGRGHLREATTFMRAARDQTGIFTDLGQEMLGVLGVGQYEPFVPSGVIDIDAFLEQLFTAQLVPDSAAARGQATLLRDEGYAAAFRAYLEQAAKVGSQLEILETLTVSMRDGAAGFQGLFWEYVERNRKPWRQAYALTSTALTNLDIAFLTGALVSTETYLVSMGTPGLLTNLDEVTLPAGFAAIKA
jgi:hypothetical protein